jgi:hypothetical protein
MRKNRFLLAGLFVSILISAFALTKNVSFSTKAFAEEPGDECITSFDMGGDNKYYICPACSGVKEKLNPSKYTDCGVAPIPN